MVMQSQRKKPAWAMPSTMIIMPAKNRMVAQLMPLVLSEASPAAYQNSSVPICATFKVSQKASKLRMAKPKTNTQVAAPQPKVTMWRSILSIMIMTNIMTKIVTAKILANISFSFLFIIPASESLSWDTFPGSSSNECICYSRRRGACPCPW